MLRAVTRLIPVLAAAITLCVPLTGAAAASCARKHEERRCVLPAGTEYSNSAASQPTASFSVFAAGRRTVRGLGPVQSYWQLSAFRVCDSRLPRDIVFASGINKRLKVGYSATSTQTGTADRKFKSLRLVMTVDALSASRATLSGTMKATFANDPATGQPLYPACDKQFSFSLARRS